MNQRQNYKNEIIKVKNENVGEYVKEYIGVEKDMFKLAQK